MPAKEKPKKPTKAELEKRAEQTGYTITSEGDVWYAEIHGTKWGPMATVEELDEFLPREG